MKSFYFLMVCGFFFLSCQNNRKEYQLQYDTYLDKMKGAWVGQMAGVGQGLPTEFKYIDTIIPYDKVPEWNNEMVNQQGNDDLYVEMTFLGSMDKHGVDVSIRQAGIDFANTFYTLWAANKKGRENLRFGIAPPESSHPAYNLNCDDIDYQIEADYSGIIAPGMPNVAIQLGEKFGRLMNYGDGLYGGQFVGGMYSAAYFENDIRTVIEKGLECIPSQSLYHKCISDVLKWYDQHPDNFQYVWKQLQEKYYRSKEFQPFARQNEDVWIPIDAKLNGAYIVMGLLFGEGDMDSTIYYSMRCGMDSDCNPSNAAGILATTIGFENLPGKFKKQLNYKKKFSYTDYNFEELIQLCERFTIEFVERNGGEVIYDDNQPLHFVIPYKKPVPSPFVPSYDPGPYDSSNKYSESEMDQIIAYSTQHFDTLLDDRAIPLAVEHCGKQVPLEFTTKNGEQDVFRTSLANPERPVCLKYLPENQDFPIHASSRISFMAGHETGQSWKLKVRYKHHVLIDTIIGPSNSLDNWMKFEVELPGYKGELVEFNAAADRSEKSIHYWKGFGLDFY